MVVGEVHDEDSGNKVLNRPWDPFPCFQKQAMNKAAACRFPDRKM